MAIMITGGTGLIGSHVARHLLQEKGESDLVLFEVYPNYSQIADIRDRVTVVRGNVLEPTELLGAMQRYEVDRVIHLAYIRGGEDNPSSSIKINCVGTTNVFEAARLQGVKRVVFASSGVLCGPRKSLAGEVIDEDATPVVTSLYGACKLFNEYEAEFYWNKYGLDVVCLRVSGVLGPGRLQRGLASPGPIAQRSVYDAPGVAALGQAVVMPPDDQVMDWIYGPDAAEALYCALMAKEVTHRIYNMCSDNWRAGEMTSLIRKHVPNAQITVDAEPWEALRLMSNERLRTELGFQPRYTLETGLGEYLQMILADSSSA